MSDQKSYWNESYLKMKRESSGYVVNDSLIEFFQSKVMTYLNSKKRIKILETGCGGGSFLEGFVGPNFILVGLDFSEDAIRMAQNRVDDSRFQFLQGDVSTMNWQKEFDLVIDSHCLHCLVENELRKKYFAGVKRALPAGGVFAFESMIAHDDLNFSDYFLYLEEEKTLLQQIGTEVVPVRKILPAKVIEEELVTAGFNIIYFAVALGKKVIPDEGRTSPVEGDPELLRVICTKR